MTFTIWYFSRDGRTIVLASKELCDWFGARGYNQDSIIVLSEDPDTVVLSPKVKQPIGCFFLLVDRDAVFYADICREFVGHFFPQGLPEMTIAPHDDCLHVWAFGEPQYRIDRVLTQQDAIEWLADLLAPYEQTHGA